MTPNLPITELATDRDHNAVGARVRLRPPESVPGRLDGGWWPRSGVLVNEIAELIDALTPRIGVISRVLYPRNAWRQVPRKMLLGGRIVHLGGFLWMDRDTVELIGSDRRRATIVVIAADSPEGPATVALAAAANGTTPRTGG